MLLKQANLRLMRGGANFILIDFLFQHLSSTQDHLFKKFNINRVRVTHYCTAALVSVIIILIERSFHSNYHNCQSGTLLFKLLTGFYATHSKWESLCVRLSVRPLISAPKRRIDLGF